MRMLLFLLLMAPAFVMAQNDHPQHCSSAEAERRMNQQYEANLVLARKPIPAGEENNAATVDGVTKVQAAWRPCRDAMLAFAAARYPSASAIAFRAYFAEERYRLIAEMGRQIYRE